MEHDEKKPNISNIGHRERRKVKGRKLREKEGRVKKEAAAETVLQEERHDEYYTWFTEV
jgi:hypothetical protein